MTKVDAPLKVLIEDLVYFEKTDLGWIYRLEDGNLLLDKIHIQGDIVKIDGFSNEILILDDGTSKIKVIITGRTPGNLSWINTGVYCSVVGTLTQNGKLPVIIADKIAEITNMVLKDIWPYEVKELEDVMLDRVDFPLIPENSDPEDYVEP